MNDLTTWHSWISANTPLVYLAFIVLAGIASKLFLALMKERKDKEDENVNKLVESIDRLVDRMDLLFEKNDEHEARLGRVEGSVNAHLAKCVEREKVLNDIKKKQTFHINKFNDALVTRKTEPVCPDRTDREN